MQNEKERDTVGSLQNTLASHVYLEVLRFFHALLHVPWCSKKHWCFSEKGRAMFKSKVAREGSQKIEFMHGLGAKQIKPRMERFPYSQKTCLALCDVVRLSRGEHKLGQVFCRRQWTLPKHTTHLEQGWYWAFYFQWLLRLRLAFCPFSGWAKMLKGWERRKDSERLASTQKRTQATGRRRACECGTSVIGPILNSPAAGSNT